jgi:uncharacterized membrane protein (UPF0182 family)
VPRRPLRILVLAIFALLFLGGPSLVRFYTDWLWFGEVGYQQVFSTIVRSEASLFTITFVCSVIWLVFNLRLALGSVGEGRPIFTTNQGMEVALPGRQQLRTIASAVAMVLSALIGLFASSQWETWVTWRHAVPFGQADPILGRDVAFYVFTIPFVQFVRGLAQTLVVMAALGSGAIYLVSGSLTSGLPSIVSMTPAVRRHLSVLGALFFVLLAVGAWLGRYELLMRPAGVIYGASYADVYGRMPTALVLTAVSVLGAVLALMHAFTRRIWPIPVAIALYFLVSIGGEAYSTMLQRFVVTPNEQARESPFIQHNIDATRRAFALDRVEEKALSGDAMLTRNDIIRNATTLENVRLWDPQPLLDTFGQLQEIRTYYDFVSVDNDRYTIDGRDQQVMLSARELNSNSLPNRTWVNERLTFTHGYGLTLGPVSKVTSEGLPVLYVRNLPTETIPDLPIQEPSLYFGELSSDYVIVRTRTREFHYPRGDENVFTQYAGSGGLALESLGRRLMFALRFGAYQIAFNDDITGESRILFHRNIAERVEEIAPFLTFDRDPYLVLAEGRLFWMYDAYTTSGRYPYSTPAGTGLNYIRNSVKVVIDAYNGTTIFYAADPADPIVATYGVVFPGMFKPLDQMPAPLRAHIRYPEDIFGIQAAVFATYHMTEPAVFYNREDQWEIPTIDDATDARAMQPYYTVMRLPGEADAEFIQMLPFTPRRKDNLAAWLVARSDSAHYGDVRVFQFPKQKVVFGPRQVVARINQDQTISPQITLWNQQGSQVTWGTLMVIPIEESLIYVRPLYLRGAGGRIPELTRVVVVYQDQIVMEPTFEEALAKLFGPGAGAAPPRGQPAVTETASGRPAAQPPTPAASSSAPVAAQLPALATEAQTHYQRALDAQRAGNWAQYGEEIKALGQTLDRMKQ